MANGWAYNMRSAVIILAGVGLVSANLPATAQSTTRIETRPFYGATVTVEEGVRVFRPLPPHNCVIINPDGKAAVSLNLNQAHIDSRTYIHSVDGDKAGSSRYIRRIGETQPLSGPR